MDGVVADCGLVHLLAGRGQAILQAVRPERPQGDPGEHEQASDPHPTHNQLLGLDSVGDIPQGSYFAYTFSEKGIFGYHNEKKPEEAGTIIVR